REGEPEARGRLRRSPAKGAQRGEDVRRGRAGVGVELDHRRMKLGLRTAREAAPIERRDELGPASDLLERRCVDDHELFLDSEGERRRPLAEPRLDRHYWARTPWTGRPAAIHA